MMFANRNDELSGLDAIKMSLFNIKVLGTLAFLSSIASPIPVPVNWYVTIHTDCCLQQHTADSQTGAHQYSTSYMSHVLQESSDKSVIELQQFAKKNKPNLHILNKLQEEMRKLAAQRVSRLNNSF